MSKIVWVTMSFYLLVPPIWDVSSSYITYLVVLDQTCSPTATDYYWLALSIPCPLLFTVNQTWDNHGQKQSYWNAIKWLPNLVLFKYQKSWSQSKHGLLRMANDLVFYSPCKLLGYSNTVSKTLALNTDSWGWDNRPFIAQSNDNDETNTILLFGVVVMVLWAPDGILEKEKNSHSQYSRFHYRRKLMLTSYNAQ